MNLWDKNMQGKNEQFDAKIIGSKNVFKQLQQISQNIKTVFSGKFCKKCKFNSYVCVM